MQGTAQRLLGWERGSGWRREGINPLSSATGRLQLAQRPVWEREGQERCLEILSILGDAQQDTALSIVMGLWS